MTIEQITKQYKLTNRTIIENFKDKPVLLKSAWEAYLYTLKLQGKITGHQYNTGKENGFLKLMQQI